MGQIEGKVALITGAARGQGAAEARLFAAEGAKVMLTDVLVEEGQKTASEIGAGAGFLRHDVSSEPEWLSVVAETVKRFGRLDILVNNAGIAMAGDVESLSLEDYMKVIAVNQVGVFLGMKAATPALKVQGGAIVNISSTAGMRGSTTIGYTASKWAVRGMTQSAAITLAPYGIRVNSVHPGLTETDMLRPIINSPRLQQQYADINLGRVGQPEEIANLVLFLASDASSFCTGAEFVADGGQISHL